MHFDPEIHHRRSIRWEGYDYSSRGLYFVTICAHERERFLSRIENGKSLRSDAGEAVQAAWYGIPLRFPSVELDAFVVMPNHIHGILAFVGTGLPASGRSIPDGTITAPPLGKVMRAFKSLSAIAGNKKLGRAGTPFWQRNYYEHVIRDAKECLAIQRYIDENPARWEFDPENPRAKNPDQRMPWEGEPGERNRSTNHAP